MGPELCRQQIRGHHCLRAPHIPSTSSWACSSHNHSNVEDGNDIVLFYNCYLHCPVSHYSSHSLQMCMGFAEDLQVDANSEGRKAAGIALPADSDLSGDSSQENSSLVMPCVSLLTISRPICTKQDEFTCSALAVYIIGSLRLFLYCISRGTSSFLMLPIVFSNYQFRDFMFISSTLTLTQLKQQLYGLRMQQWCELLQQDLVAKSFKGDSAKRSVLTANVLCLNTTSAQQPWTWVSISHTEKCCRIPVKCLPALHSTPRGDKALEAPPLKCRQMRSPAAFPALRLCPVPMTMTRMEKSNLPCKPPSSRTGEIRTLNTKIAVSLKVLMNTLKLKSLLINLNIGEESSSKCPSWYNL